LLLSTVRKRFYAQSSLTYLPSRAAQGTGSTDEKDDRPSTLATFGAH
jgi:hypothetical protein